MILGVVSKEDNPEALSLSARVVEWLRERGASCLIEDHIAHYMGCHTTQDVWRASDLLIVIGGDGTILRAVRMSQPRQIPILGVHMGYLGFLTEVTGDEIMDCLDRLLAGDYGIESRSMLDIALARDGVELARQCVINDVVVAKGALARIIHIEVWTDDVFITSYWGDGLIVSTPTGSTAYNLAAGGPIVHPDVGAVVLNPICPHVLSNRAIVLPAERAITVVVRSGKVSDSIYLSLDGQRGHTLVEGDVIRVKRAGMSAMMVRFSTRNYFEVLRSKLKWQER